MAVGRPKKEVDAAQLRALAALGHTREEAAAVLGVHRNTLGERMKSDETLQAVWDEGRADLAGRLRKAQIDCALKGNAIMLIWCGKQYLSQADAPKDVKVTTEHHFIAVWGDGPAPIKALPAEEAADVIEGEILEEDQDDIDTDGREAPEEE
jgi:hypothetical protein